MPGEKIGKPHRNGVCGYVSVERLRGDPGEQAVAVFIGMRQTSGSRRV